MFLNTRSSKVEKYIAYRDATSTTWTVVNTNVAGVSGNNIDFYDYDDIADMFKSKMNDIFNQSENIEDTNILSPLMSNEIFKVEAEKKELAKKSQDSENEKDEIDFIGLINRVKSMSLIHEYLYSNKDLSNIVRVSINKKPFFYFSNLKKYFSFLLNITLSVILNPFYLIDKINNNIRKSS